MKPCGPPVYVLLRAFIRGLQILLLLASIAPSLTAATNGSFQILVFSKTAGFRHASISDGIAAINDLAALNNFGVVATEDASVFTDAGLAPFKAVIFLSTTGDILNDNQQAAFENYIRGGGGFVGVHSASDTEYTWPWYGGLIGAYLTNHPAIQNANIIVEDTNDLSTLHLPATWVRNDEWYNFQTNPRANVHVLCRLDESSYSGGTMGDHPIAWYHNYDGGRAWYTAGGHTSASFYEPMFRLHLLGGIRYAAGQAIVPQPGAIMLFDGTNTSAWVSTTGVPIGWTVSDGVLQVSPGSGDIHTVSNYNDFRLHVEFRIPPSPTNTAEQSMGNSGVYIQGRYEIQILDSYGRTLSGANDGGAVFGQKDANVNAALPDEKWETYDIFFRAARWLGNAKAQNASVTVYWNDILVQDMTEIVGPTGTGSAEGPSPGPIRLQDHGTLISFRNIWIVPLEGPPASPVTLVSTGAIWKYLDNGSNQGTNWNQVNFDDTSWASGPAMLGYGDANGVFPRTTNSFGPDPNNKYITTYYRRTFVVGNLSGLTNLTARLQRDDGAVVYLNGKEVFRSNMPTGSIGYTTLALTTIGTSDETRFYLNPVDPALLRIGTNVLAVEIHQSAANSSDIAFDLALQGEQLLSQTQPYYMTDFEGGSALNEWSQIKTSATPIGGRRFLGDFSNEVVRLSLADLPPHRTARVNFDLFLLRSWDGNGDNCCGPDIWSLSEEGGPTLLLTTFSNTADALNNQAYPGTYTQSSFPGGYGAAEVNTLGYLYGAGVRRDSVYRVSIPFAHTNNSLALLFAGSQLQGITNESWGLDNVSVELGNELLPAPASKIFLVEPTSAWKYLDNGSNQGTNWIDPAFNDSTWPSGRAELGYGDDNPTDQRPEATLVSYGPNASAKYTTTYFRDPFNVSNRRAITNLVLGLVRDDGAIVYMNGVEVFRSNMPPGPANYLTLASSAASDDGARWFTTTLDPGLLLEGINVFAVEIHQNAAASSDISFDLYLRADTSPCVILVNNRPATGSMVITNSAEVQIVSSLSNAVLFYTLDGAYPGTGPFYYGPFTVNQSMTLRAIAYAADYSISGESPSVNLTVVATPSLTQQPENRDRLVGQSVSFSVSAAGSGFLGYQWYFNDNPIPNSDTNILTIPNLHQTDAGLYSVLVMNNYGVIRSAPASLNVYEAASISTQPASVNVFLNNSATFSVVAGGTSPIAYQWRHNGVNIPDQTNSTFHLDQVTVDDGGSYTVVVGNDFGTLISDPAQLIVETTPMQPGDNFVDAVRISGPNGIVSGTNTLATKEPSEPNHGGKPGGRSVWYRWQAPATGIASFGTEGSTFDTLLGVYTGTNVSTLTAIASDEDSGGSLTSEVQFNAVAGIDYAIAIDGFGASGGYFLLSWSIESTAQQVPVILTPPHDVAVEPGTDALFSVIAAGKNLSYEWLFDNVAIPGANASTLAVSNAQIANIGFYQVRITNEFGQLVMSPPANLELVSQPSPPTKDKLADVDTFSPTNHFLLLGKGNSSLMPISLGVVGYYGFQTANSTTDPFDPANCAITVGSQWIKVAPTSDGIMSIDTITSEVATVLAVYRGGDISDITPSHLITCDVNGAPDGHSLVRFDTVHDATYSVLIGTMTRSNGTIYLHYALGVPPVVGQSSGATIVNEGGTLSLTPSLSTSIPTASFQWYQNGSRIQNATNVSLFLGNLQPTDAGIYSLTASNAIGMSSNIVARVTVNVSLHLDFAASKNPGPLEFRVFGAASRGFFIQSTTNFLNWIPLYTNATPYLPINFVDPAAATAPLRFYRARPWP